VITKGILYRHDRRPEWGLGMLVSVDGIDRFTLLFSDAGTRRCTAEFLREVDPDALKLEQPKLLVPPRRPRASSGRLRESLTPRSTQGARRTSEAGLCPQCGGARPPERWGCDPCRVRKNAQEKARRAQLRSTSQNPPGMLGGKGLAWTVAELDRLSALVPGSRSDSELREHFPARSVKMIKRKRVELGLLRGAASNPFTPDELARIDALKLTGARDKEVAAQLGRTTSSIRQLRWRRKAGS